MKIWLDDIRQPPDESWVWIQNAESFRVWVQCDPNGITHISFDHDLGDTNDPEITGYTCLCWIEKIWWNDVNYTLPVLTVHSANPVGRLKMQKLIDRMARG